MYLQARVTKSSKSKFWLAECPALCIMTQGESLAEAKEFLSDAITSVLPDLQFKTEWHSGKDGEGMVHIADISQGLAAIVKRNREESDLTFAEAAERIGSSSKNSVFAYESGNRDATFATLDKLLNAFGKKLVLSVESGK